MGKEGREILIRAVSGMENIPATSHRLGQGQSEYGRVGDCVAILTSTPDPRTMEPKDTRAVPCCPSDSKSRTRDTWGIELGPQRAIGHCDHCHNHGLATQIRGENHFCLFQACRCHNYALFLALPAVSGFKREQGAELKRELAQGPIKTMAAAPKSHVHVKRLAIETGVLTGKENTMPQPVAHTGMSPQEESPQGPLLLNHLPEPSSQPCPPPTLEGSLAQPYTTNAAPPPTLEQQLTVSLSRERRGASALLSISGRKMMVQISVSGKMQRKEVWKGKQAKQEEGLAQATRTNGPAVIWIPTSRHRKTPPHILLVVPYDQASVSASLEWQRKLEAAEALLALKNSSQAPPNSISLHQPLNPPGPAGDRGPQTPSPCPESRPPGSVTLPIGHLGCISLLN